MLRVRLSSTNIIRGRIQVASCKIATIQSCSSTSSLSNFSSSSSSLTPYNKHNHHHHPKYNIQILPEVQNGLETNKPIIALESTILSHGLPYPQNIDLSNMLSQIIREKQCIPATIAIKNNICQVGLSKEDIYDLTIANLEHRVEKCTTRDLPFLLSRKNHHNDSNHNDNTHNNSNSKIQWGATTVASTMKIAHLAGISTFVTGGTGGVHRNVESTMDISSDILELSRTPVIVISAGIKSILDIEKTLEYLETMSVPVASYQTNEFPAFFSPKSGVISPKRVDCPTDIAHAYYAGKDIGLQSGMLIAVPNYDPAGENVEYAIQQSIKEAKDAGITGRDVTPFILRRVNERTDGDSLRSNIALVKRNAEVGADIAIQVAKLRNDRQRQNQWMMMNNNSNTITTSSDNNTITTSRVVIVGGAVVDIVAKSKNDIIPSTSNPGSCTESDGGVARNIADVLGQLGTKPILFTAVGDDDRGKALRQRMEEEYDIPIERQHIKVVPTCNTATYLAILDASGDLYTAIADMDILREIPIPDDQYIAAADYLVIDANPPIETILKIVQTAKKFDTKVVFDPTSVPKVSYLKDNHDFLSCISFAFPNIDELLSMTTIKTEEETQFDYHHALYYGDNDIFLRALESLTTNVLHKMHPVSAHIIVTLGSKGAFLASKDDSSITYHYFAVNESLQDVENCTGAGDTMVGVFVKSLLDGNSVVTSIEKGMNGSLESLKCANKAIPKLNSK